MAAKNWIVFIGREPTTSICHNQMKTVWRGCLSGGGKRSGGRQSGCTKYH
jgi:hypothetical protein